MFVVCFVSIVFVVLMFLLFLGVRCPPRVVVCACLWVCPPLLRVGVIVFAVV